MKPKIILHSFLLVVAAVLSGVALAAGLSLDAAKQQGLVGEQYDGYLGAVPAAPAPEVRALVTDVNTKRRTEYERIAQANGIALSDVEALAGQKAIQRTVPGHYVKPQGQSWQRK